MIKCDAPWWSTTPRRTCSRLPRATTSPPSYARRRGRSPPIRGAPDAPAPSEPPRADSLEVDAILPEGDDGLGAAKLLPTELSPELAQLLDSAEQRVAHLRPSSAP